MAIPQHVAVIMDGNGRWAQRSHLPRVYGHRMGLETAKRCVDKAIAAGVGHLTLFALSTENMQRPRAEVDFLLALFAKMLRDELAVFLVKNVRLQIMGDRTLFPESLQGLIDDAESKSRENDGLLLTLAVNYSGRWQLTEVVKSLVSEGISSVSEASISARINADVQSDPDLLIRTGNEQRISNFMLWSMAYTELYFSDKLWPDFSSADFDHALEVYAARNRRYGGIEGGSYE
jgi:undecaprenyl diphosphate synthase